jgi:hypothetical protein
LNCALGARCQSSGDKGRSRLIASQAKPDR